MLYCPACRGNHRYKTRHWLINKLSSYLEILLSGDVKIFEKILISISLKYCCALIVGINLSVLILGIFITFIDDIVLTQSEVLGKVTPITTLLDGFEEYYSKEVLSK